MPLIIILAESALELIPEEIRNDVLFKKKSKKGRYTSQLLDTALHSSMMKKLAFPKKRGRPDIVHLCLLNALGSPLNKVNQLRLFIHTINNEIFEINPDIRIPRNYNRFKGLMAKLLDDGEINTEDIQLITKFKGSIDSLIQDFPNPEIYLLSSKGREIDIVESLFSDDSGKNYIIIIGGFQKGHFSDDLLSLSSSKNLISISPHSLDAWVVISKIINLYELKLKIL